MTTTGTESSEHPEHRPAPDGAASQTGPGDRTEPGAASAEPATPQPTPGGAPTAPRGSTPAAPTAKPTDWPLWEVFVRSRRGLSHTHAGSLHAPDAEMALRNARDLYTRRSEGISIWVVPSAAISASSPDEKDSFFEPAADKPYRHPTFYEIPDGVQHL